MTGFDLYIPADEKVSVEQTQTLTDAHLKETSHQMLEL